MNVQLAIVIFAAAASVIYVVRRMINDWRHTQSGGCTSCPIAKFRSPL